MWALVQVLPIKHNNFCLTVMNRKLSNGIAGNGHGLAMWWNLKIVRPEPQPNKITKDEANKQKPNRIRSAETAADSDKMLKLTKSSHHIAKPPVVRRLSCECCRSHLYCCPLLLLCRGSVYKLKLICKAVHSYDSCSQDDELVSPCFVNNFDKYYCLV